MTQKMLAGLLCAVVLAALFLPVEAATSSDLSQVMNQQIWDEIQPVLTQQSNYADEETAEYAKKIDFSKVKILVDHKNTLMELGEMPLQEVTAASEKTYYLQYKNELYSASIKAGAYDPSVSIRKCELLPKHLQAINTRSISPLLCGKQREIREVYAFRESGMYAIVFVTADGNFVRLYTDQFPHENTNYVDMPMEEYSAWVAAFRDFTITHEEPAYLKFGDVAINTLGELVSAYDSPQDYYRSMEQLELKKQRYDFWIPAIFIMVFAVAVGIAVFLVYCRRTNRKKYGC